MRFHDANRGNPNAWREAMIQLGKVQVVQGNEPTEIEVKMPVGSGF